MFDSEETFKTHLSGIQHNKLIKNDADSDEYDSDDEEFSDDCYQCGAVFTSFETLIDYQRSYLRCDKCQVGLSYKI